LENTDKPIEKPENTVAGRMHQILLERREEIREMGYSLADFQTEKLGIKRDYLSESAKVGRNIGVNIVQKFAQIFPDIDLNWLFLGDDFKGQTSGSKKNISDLDMADLEIAENRIETLEDKLLESKSEIDKLKTKIIELQDDLLRIKSTQEPAR
jgi:hypothetical protein